ncbi:MAG: ABC transporter substrate-binding protein [Chloroflexi bacterium]|nr:ABC transporter substrate-binding protein [Chloroflexota bacterium]
MSKKILWLVVSGLMALSLVLAACGPAATTPTTPPAPATPSAPAPTVPAAPATPAAEKPQQEAVKPAAGTPQYGGTLNLQYNGGALSFDDSNVSPNIAVSHVNQKLLEGDWTKGKAGGYGTGETTWGFEYNDLPDYKTGILAESVKWSADAAKNEGTIVYQIRQGVHWALDSKNEASRLMAGREFTADDVIFNLKRNILTPGMRIYANSPGLRVAEITKTGPWEVSIKLPLDALMLGISRFTDSNVMYPPDVIKKYGNMNDWRNLVGTGPYIFTDYVPGSSVILKRNPNYWQTDPIGPGKGNQIPYLDTVKFVGIPDLSTTMAAFRTGKIDKIDSLALSEATQLRKENKGYLETFAASAQARAYIAAIVHDKPPFSDIRVRQAMMLSIDFKGILQNLYQGEGVYYSYPFGYQKEYAEAYLALDDPEYPPEARELYSYNPEKAKQLLKEAGYPNGFKTSIILNGNSLVDYYSIIKDMWAKVGIQLEFDIKDSGAFSNILNNRSQTALIAYVTSPIAQFLASTQLIGEGATNAAKIDDPVVQDYMNKVNLAAVTDLHEAMKIYKEMSKYVVQQTWAIPEVRGYIYTFWWPWLRNYSGEFSVGYADYTWDRYIWYDQALKKSMGY